MKKLIIITLFIYVLIIGMIFKIGDIGISNPYLEEHSFVQEFTNLLK